MVVTIFVLTSVSLFLFVCLQYLSETMIEFSLCVNV